MIYGLVCDIANSVEIYFICVYKRERKSVMIHKAMEEFYVFVSSEDTLEHFGDNSGGQFRVQYSQTYPMKDKWECALLNVSFVPAFEAPTKRAYV